MKCKEETNDYVTHCNNPNKKSSFVFDLDPPLKISTLSSSLFFLSLTKRESIFWEGASFFLLFSNFICLSLCFSHFLIFCWDWKKNFQKCGEPQQNQQIHITRFAPSVLMSPIPNSRSKYPSFPLCLILLNVWLVFGLVSAVFADFVFFYIIGHYFVLFLCWNFYHIIRCHHVFDGKGFLNDLWHVYVGILILLVLVN